jgi:hypothetical protein
MVLHGAYRDAELGGDGGIGIAGGGQEGHLLFALAEYVDSSESGNPRMYRIFAAGMQEGGPCGCRGGGPCVTGGAVTTAGGIRGLGRMGMIAETTEQRAVDPIGSGRGEEGGLHRSRVADSVMGSVAAVAHWPRDAARRAAHSAWLPKPSENSTSTGLVSEVVAGAMAGRPKSLAMPTRSASRSVQTASLRASLTGPVARSAQWDASLARGPAAVATDPEAGANGPPQFQVTVKETEPLVPLIVPVLAILLKVATAVLR